jgi:hypothetical protein
MLKKCRVCEEIKDLSEFHKKKDTSDGHRHECKNCVKVINVKYKNSLVYITKRKEYDKVRYEKNKEVILKRKKEYYKENSKCILSYKENYRKNNKDKINEWRKLNIIKIRESMCRYRKKYPHIIVWRSILYSALKRLGKPKNNKTIDILGYSPLELKEHIEKLFKSGMSWDNHGEWHIDHIKPVTSFNSDALVSDVCSLENLQPLWASENLSKNNKIYFIYK